MTPRILSEWLWCTVAIYIGLFLIPTQCNSVRQPPSNPSTIEAQAKFFQDFFSVQLSPYKIEFGHVCEDPNTWEQRYEKKDFKNHRDMGKVRWGDKKGGYGEHYWDLNHAGHTNDHDDGYDRNSDDDDGSYHENNDPYDEPTYNSPTYGVEEYDPEKASSEESGRAKRAHPKVKVERTNYSENERRKRKNIEPTTRQSEDVMKPQYRTHEDTQEQENSGEKNQVVLVFKHKDKENDQQNFEPKKKSPVNRGNHYVPYEDGSGVREHQHPEVTAAASIPRLFLEPSTGHVVDRATGQAYILQPIRNQYLES